MFDIHQMIDSLIEETNALMQSLVSGNYTGFCTLYADIMGKLVALRKGVKEDADAKAAQMEDLKAQIKRLQELEVEDGGYIDGGETQTYSLFEGD